MVETEPVLLWQRFPVAAQRLRAALFDAAFPAVAEAVATLAPLDAESWRVRVLLPASGAVYEETFSGVELRAYRGRWDEWADTLAARLATARSLGVSGTAP